MVVLTLLLVLQTTVDPDLPDYKAEVVLKGSVASVGSETLSNLMTLWAEELHKKHPDFKVWTEGQGATLAMPALLNGNSSLGPMSRLPNEEELRTWRAKRGRHPVLLPVALDAIGAVVHKDNPLKELTLQQLDAIWSTSRKRGAPKNLITWGDLGLEGEWAEKPIKLYGRNSASGTYLFFKTRVLLNGDFKEECHELPGTAVLVNQVASDRFSMGFGGLPYVSPGTKALAIAAESDSEAVAPTPESTRSGRYPLSRYLYVAIDQEPGKPLSPGVREFFNLVYSRQGQEIVIKDGWYPMTAAQGREELENLGSQEPYQNGEAVKGQLVTAGSDTLNYLMTSWAEGLKRFQPEASIQIAGRGTSAVMPVLGKGVPLVPLSRPMKEAERLAFEQRQGYPPLEFRVAVDAFAVFVHKDNPIGDLSLQQVDALFSKKRKRGGAPLATWRDLGLTGDWAAKPLQLYGRNSASGTYSFFKELVLQRGDFKDEVKEQAGSASVVLGCAQDPSGIGYSGVQYLWAGVHAVKIDGIPATKENCRSGKYPLSRYLYLYVDRDPDKPWDPLVRDLIRYALSREGQKAVTSDGYFSLPPAVLREEIRKLD